MDPSWTGFLESQPSMGFDLDLRWWGLRGRAGEGLRGRAGAGGRPGRPQGAQETAWDVLEVRRRSPGRSLKCAGGRPGGPQGAQEVA